MSDFSDVEELVGKLTRATRKIEAEANKELNEIGTLVQNKMRELAPEDTGFLKEHIQIVRTPGRVSVGPVGVPYARAQEYGAKPHKITAKPGKVLAFKMGGQTVFARSVNHPGNKPQPFVKPTREWAAEELPKRLKSVGKEVLDL